VSASSNAGITPSQLLARIESGGKPAIVDVRSSWEFSRGRVPGALNRPYWALFFGLARVPFKTTEPVVVYCQHGPRARIAGEALRRRGYSQVIYLTGHMARWRREHLREERDG
jgi:rhodanese-related sulfurtransferase